MPIRFARQLTDQPSAHRADEPCVIRSRAARRNSRSEKAVGEADSFPYRLINDFYFRYHLRARRRCWTRPRCRSWTRCHSSCRRRRCSRSRCSCRRRGRRRTPTACGYVVHTHAWCQGGFEARERREHSQILLDATGCRLSVVAARVPVDHRKRIRAFGQYHFELGVIATSGGGEVGGLPPDDELPVRRSSQRLREDTAVWADTRLIGAQVVIVRKQGI